MTSFAQDPDGGQFTRAEAPPPSTREGAAEDRTATRTAWLEVARTAITSRMIDEIEESELFPSRKITNQFSARGHELVQAIVAQQLHHQHDAAQGYYRSRPLLLGAGLTAREAFASSLARTTGRSAGRDVGVILSLPPRRGVTILPGIGDVGGQYTVVAGWAQAIAHRATELGEREWNGAIAVALGGDASVATGGFWSALTLATTLSLPMLFVIEDNGIAISTPSTLQTPGGNIASNLEGFDNLRVLDASGTDPFECWRVVEQGVNHVRTRRSPALVRARVTRLCSHSALEARAPVPEGTRDPIAELRAFMESAGLLDEQGWAGLESATRRALRDALDQALSDSLPDPAHVRQHLFASGVGQRTAPCHVAPARTNQTLTFKQAVRHVLEQELTRDPRVVVLGEDVGAKGGVHGVTAGLHARFGSARVMDTSLSEEGIIGRSVGMALAGLRPVPEIQFRKYLDTATEQINNCGTLRWRTAGAFAAPVVVRVPVGHHARVNDPWHSVSAESVLARAIGWRVAFPSNAGDAAGLLREALRGDDPTFFLEHRNLLASSRASSADPGPEHVLPFGRARVVSDGTQVTVITWGDMVYRALDAAATLGAGTVEVIDLRSLAPWDVEAVVGSVRKTGRCLVLHEDTLTGGFGAEIAAVVAREAFLHLEAPVERVGSPDVPLAYDHGLADATLPRVEDIAARLSWLMAY